MNNNRSVFSKNEIKFSIVAGDFGTVGAVLINEEVWLFFDDVVKTLNISGNKVSEFRKAIKEIRHLKVISGFCTIANVEDICEAVDIALPDNQSTFRKWLKKYSAKSNNTEEHEQESDNNSTKEFEDELAKRDEMIRNLKNELDKVNKELLKLREEKFITENMRASLVSVLKSRIEVSTGMNVSIHDDIYVKCKKCLFEELKISDWHKIKQSDYNKTLIHIANIKM